MSVARHLYEYLVDTDAIDGAMGASFASGQPVGRYTINDRAEARQQLRAIIGQAIYYNRHPREMAQTRQHSALLLRSIDMERSYVLGGESQFPIEFLRAEGYARGGDARDRATNIIELFSLAVSGFHGGKWGERDIAECLCGDETSSAISPIDGSDDWVFIHTVDLTIYHRAAVATYGG